VSKITQSSDISKRLSLYSVAAGAGALASGAAFGQVVETGISEQVSVNTLFDSDSVMIDVNNDGIDNFELRVSTSFSDDYCGSATFEGQGAFDRGVEDMALANVDSAYAGMLAEGTTIDSQSDFASFSSVVLYGGCYSPEGNFPPTTRGFIGFQFEAGLVVSGEGADDSQPQGVIGDIHFGYADVEVSSGGINNYTATIHNIWFESTPNAPITIPTGEPEPEQPAPLAVPVGGAVPLGLLLFAAGAMALRRRSRTGA